LKDFKEDLTLNNRKNQDLFCIWKAIISIKTRLDKAMVTMPRSAYRQGIPQKASHGNSTVVPQRIIYYTMIEPDLWKHLTKPH